MTTSDVQADVRYAIAHRLGELITMEATDYVENTIALADAVMAVLPVTRYDGGIWEQVQRERERAHAKHGDTSMESLPVEDLTRLTVLLEEVGEVARWFNESRRRDMQNGELRAELIQVAAMAGAWADALTYRPAVTS